MAKKGQAQKIPEQLNDFRSFLYLVWKELGLPEPTPVQYDIARTLQHGERRQIIQAFRGAGKSYITSAFVLWNLLHDPDRKIMVVSASSDRAKDFSTFAHRLMSTVPLLQRLQPGPNQRNSFESFDVGPAKSAHQPSVKSVGITGQLTGARADLIIADDVEVPGNSATEIQREKLSSLVREFDAILKDENSRVVYLGTPQTEMSLYKTLGERGYQAYIWPARAPSKAQIEGYHGVLGPVIRKQLDDDPKAPERCGGRGAPTEPRRFDDKELYERELAWGRAGFALQYMLDTSLSDVDKYPLKLSDLIVYGLDQRYAPVSLSWGNDQRQLYDPTDLPTLGLSGDRFYGPLWVSEDVAEYAGTVMAIDPSGRGKDETAYAVVRELHGNLFLVDVGGLKEGYSENTLRTLAAVAKRWDAGQIYVESNHGDGMFLQLLRPYLESAGVLAGTEELRVNTQKEQRLVDTLEPLMRQHRLVVDPQVIRNDYETTKNDPSRSLFHQMSRLTRERGALQHDDRLDALYMGVHWWLRALDQDQHKQAEAHREELMWDELEEFLEKAQGPGVQQFRKSRSRSFVSPR